MSGLLSFHSIKERDWNVRNGSSTPWYDRFTYPAAAWHQTPGVVFFCWESGTDSARTVNVRTWSPTAGWSATVVTPFVCLTDDSHGVPSHIRLSNGHYVIAGGAHNNPVRLMTSDNPDDISAWTNQSSIGASLTYPHMSELGGKLYVRARGYNTDDTESRYGSFYTLNFSGGTLTLESSLRFVDFGSDSRFYGGPQRVVGDEIWFGATRWHVSDGLRRDIFFFRYNPTAGTLKNIDGTVSETSFPITNRNDFRIVNQTDAGEDGNAPDWCYDASGNIHFLYIETTTGSNWELKHRVWNGTTLSAANDTGLITDSRTTYCLTPWGDHVAAFFAHSDDFALFGDTIMAVYNGTSWGSNVLVRAHSGRFGYAGQSRVENGPASARMVFCERQQTESGALGVTRNFLYGEDGFVKAPPT